MKYIICIWLLVISGVSLPNSSFNVSSCENCTSSQKQQNARIWARNNITILEAVRGISKLVHVVDFSNSTIITYKMNLYNVKLPPPANSTWVPNSVVVTTPSDVMSEFLVAERPIRQLKDLLDRTVIPSSVVGNAWEFVNCLYCQNVVQDYIRVTFQGELETVLQTVQSIFIKVGVLKETFSSTYKFALESGGYIMVEVKITGDLELSVEVKQVVDSGGNTVPKTATSLRGMNLWISDLNAANNINSYIVNFNFSVPQRVGIVTVEDCHADHRKCDDINN